MRETLGPRIPVIEQLLGNRVDSKFFANFALHALCERFARRQHAAMQTSSNWGKRPSSPFAR